jgi:hypothetical protein
VTIATGHGKKAARHIDAWLGEKIYQKSANNPAAAISGSR